MSHPRNRIIRHLESLQGERHPDTAPQGLQQTARYLATGLARCGWTTNRQLFRAKGRTFPNILAVRVPNEPRTKVPAVAPLLIGAHYDTVIASPGADDNASGLVVLLEVAERCATLPLALPVWLAAFCLEEQGLLGSTAFVARLKKAKQPLTGAIILECVGYAGDQEGSQRSPPGIPISVPTVGNFLGIIGNDASRALVESVDQNVRRSAPSLNALALTVPGRGEQLPDIRRSDHAAFWDAGFPAVMLTDTANFRNPHYHQSTDTIDTLNLDFLEAVIDAVTATVQSLAGRAQHE